MDQKSVNMVPNQLTFNFYTKMSNNYSPEVVAAIDTLSLSGTEARGAIYTRAEVVDFILNLVGYTNDNPLYKNWILEPSFGGGDFLLPIVGRLLTSWRSSKKTGLVLDELGDAIRAVELHRETFQSTRASIIEFLMHEDLDLKTAVALTDRWLTQGDFLLTPFDNQFDFVVGNPPYVRQELIPAPLLAVYRNRYQTMFDRADLYIPFFERSLLLLARDGSLGFICADRWMKNRYGAPLRSLVAKQFHLKIYVDMMDSPAFHSEVSAYPAITVISQELPGPTRIAHRPVIDRITLTNLADELRAKNLSSDSGTVREMAQVPDGAEPWLVELPEQMTLLRRLEKQYPSLEEAGCTVGIGVATGADKEFIDSFEELDVEPDRKLPLVTTGDIISGEVKWRGLGVINPFAEDGSLVDLQNYPCLRRYLEARRDVISVRHCAKKSPDGWYRTIDRITPGLAKMPKLLIPDIKGHAHIVFENGKLYPHHNLYYITSDSVELTGSTGSIALKRYRTFSDYLFNKNARGIFPVPGAVPAPHPHPPLGGCIRYFTIGFNGCGHKKGFTCLQPRCLPTI